MKFLRKIIFFGLVISSLSAHAKLTVIQDNANTIKAGPYISDINLPTRANIKQAIYKQQNSIRREPSGKDLDLYPSISRFTPGYVKKHELNAEVAHNFFANHALFIVGPDQKSIDWLKKNAGFLKSINAVGIVTNVTNSNEWQKVNASTTMQLITANINGLEALIGTNHYPVLVYHNWVLQ